MNFNFVDFILLQENGHNARTFIGSLYQEVSSKKKRKLSTFTPKEMRKVDSPSLMAG